MPKSQVFVRPIGWYVNPQKLQVKATNGSSQKVCNPFLNYNTKMVEVERSTIAELMLIRNVV